MDCSASPVTDIDSLSRQLEAVRLNGIYTMEMMKSLIKIVTKFSCEVQEPKSDNTALKLQLRDLHLFHTPPPSISTEALPSDTHDAAKTYRDVLHVVTLLPLLYHPDATGRPHNRSPLLWLETTRQQMAS
jgi:hypothetical protein